MKKLFFVSLLCLMSGVSLAQPTAQPAGQGAQQPDVSPLAERMIDELVRAFRKILPNMDQSNTANELRGALRALAVATESLNAKNYFSLVKRGSLEARLSEIAQDIEFNIRNG